MGERLRQLREKRKLTQIGLQIETGVDQSQISKFESGKRIPPTETLLRLADYFGVSMDYLMGRTDNPAVNR